MTPRFTRAATALALILPAQSATALTPEEAWASIEALSSSYGQTVTVAGTDRSGDTLTVSGITYAMTVADGPTVTATVGSATFRDRGDGTVEITYPAGYEALIAFPEGADGPKSLTLAVTWDQLSIIGSGTAEAAIFDMTAAAMTFTAKDIIDQDGTALDMSGVATLTGLSGGYSAQPGGTVTTFTNDMTAETMELTVNAKEPGGEGVLSGSMKTGALAIKSKTGMVDQALIQSGNISAALAAGFMVDTALESGPISMVFDFSDRTTTGHFDGTLTGAAVHVLLNADELDYGYALRGGSFNATGFDMPLQQIASSFGEIALAIAMPVKASDTPEPFSATLRLVDLTMTEEVWAIFDPGQQLKRDPVTLITDIDGTGAWTVDILDPAAQMDSGPDLPAKLFTLELTEVLARAAGAQVAAAGGLTFDNANLQPYGGFPAPTGKITVTMDGINALLDALVAIGVVPEDDMMGARMGLAMFARPGANPDQLVSEIEFRDGGLFVNGQQMF
ncbi:MAG: DUF2125 domain-containing protein [Paracoccaceae bacterium]